MADYEHLQVQKLRNLAAWYREFAERAGNPAIWEARLLMAEDLEKEADARTERKKICPTATHTFRV
jgi:hypothetical protein